MAIASSDDRASVSTMARDASPVSARTVCAMPRSVDVTNDVGVKVEGGSNVDDVDDGSGSAGADSTRI